MFLYKKGVLKGVFLQISLIIIIIIIGKIIQNNFNYYLFLWIIHTIDYFQIIQPLYIPYHILTDYYRYLLAVTPVLHPSYGSSLVYPYFSLVVGTVLDRLRPIMLDPVRPIFCSFRLSLIVFVFVKAGPVILTDRSRHKELKSHEGGSQGKFESNKKNYIKNSYTRLEGNLIPKISTKFSKWWLGFVRCY